VAGAFLDPPQSSEIVQHLTPRALRSRGQRSPGLEGADFRQRERVAFNGRGRVRSAFAAILLELRKPLHLNSGRGNLRPEVGNDLQLPKQPGGDRKLGLEAHAA
jgi:hypothetical protein